MLSKCIARTIAILGMTAAAASGANAQNAVKIGMVMPMTGTLASAGQQVIAGARLYIKQRGDKTFGKRKPYSSNKLQEGQGLVNSRATWV